MIVLDVSGAFHSRMMRPVADEFLGYLKTVEFRPLATPVIANVTGKPYEFDQLVATLAKQIASPVLWADSVKYLLEQDDPTFEEIGPGKVLTGLIRQIRAAG